MKKPEKVSNLRIPLATLACAEYQTGRQHYWQIASLSLILFFLLNSLSAAVDDQFPRAERRASPDGGAGGARAEVGRGELYALVVGISHYKDPKIPQLKVSHKDARDFADFLKTQTKLFRSHHITLLQDEQATKDKIEKCLSRELRRAGKDDTVVLFLSGHGEVDAKYPGEFFFVTYDTEPDDLAVTALHMNRRCHWFLSKLDCKRVVLIADACHAGGFPNSGAKSLEPALLNFIQQFQESQGRVFLTSSLPDESSQEKPGKSNSVFTHYLIRGLRGAADSNKDGVVTLSELYDYVYKKTKDETKGFQSPQMEGRIVGVFPMALHDSARSHSEEMARPEMESPPERAHLENSGREENRRTTDPSRLQENKPKPDSSVRRPSPRPSEKQDRVRTRAESISPGPSEKQEPKADDVLERHLKKSGYEGTATRPLTHWK